VLNESQLAEFERRGILRLDNFVDGKSAVTMANGVWAVLAERGISRSDRATWPLGQVRKLRAIRGAQVYAPFALRFETAADCLLGQGGWVRINAPGPLVTFPEPGDWQVPRSGWHVDLPARGDADRLLALRILGVVEDVVTSAGGTVVVEGTHTLTRRLVEGRAGDYGSSADVRRRLAGDHRWFRDLFGDATNRSRFLDGSVIDGVDVRVSELTGKAGDAYLMHPWLMHAAAPNISGAPRSMITDTVYAR
jgi:hypothetical protein